MTSFISYFSGTFLRNWPKALSRRIVLHETIKRNLGLTFSQNPPSNNPPKIRRKFTKNDFALKYFDILRANLSHETNRKKVESFLILLHTPNINKQKDFTKFHTLQSSTVFGQLGARLKSTILIFKTFFCSVSNFPICSLTQSKIFLQFQISHPFKISILMKFY